MTKVPGFAIDGGGRSHHHNSHQHRNKQLLESSPGQIVQDNFRRSWSEDDEKRRSKSDDDCCQHARESDTDVSSCASSSVASTGGRSRKRTHRRGKLLHLRKSKQEQQQTIDQDKPYGTTRKTTNQEFSPTSTAVTLSAGIPPASTDGWHPPPLSPPPILNSVTGSGGTRSMTPSPSNTANTVVSTPSPSRDETSLSASPSPSSPSSTQPVHQPALAPTTSHPPLPSSSLPPRPQSPFVSTNNGKKSHTRRRRIQRRRSSASVPGSQTEDEAMPRSTTPPSTGTRQRKFFPFRKRKNQSSSSVRGSNSFSESEADTDGGSSSIASTIINSLKSGGASKRQLEKRDSIGGASDGSAPTSGGNSVSRGSRKTERHKNNSSSGMNSSKRESERDHVKCGSEDDPVVRLFEQRATQRVRFALEGVGMDDPPAASHPTASASSMSHSKKDHHLARRGSGLGSAISFSRSSSNSSGRQPDGGGPNDNKSPPSSPSRKKISRFMKGALFGGNKSEKAAVEAEVARELESVKRELVWENTATAGGEMVRTQPGELTTTFLEDPQTRAKVIKLLNKARRAQYVHFRYEYAVKCYVKALDLLQNANYPNDHPMSVKTMEALNLAHHVLSSYNNSSNIVKMGIKHEDSGELVRALKMYTIAYRIRVELLGRQHPSLVVLLNMLGNIQIRRGELHEAMQIYELALKDRTSSSNSSGSSNNKHSPKHGFGLPGTDLDLPLNAPDPPRNLLARSVTYRDMGLIYEKWGENDSALVMYHRSLDCLAKYKKLSGTNLVPAKGSTQPPISSVEVAPDDSVSASSTLGMETVTSHDYVQATESNKATKTRSNTRTATANATGGDDGMEVLVGRESEQEDNKRRVIFQASSDYDSFFPPELDDVIRDPQKHTGNNATVRSGGSKQMHQQLRGDLADIDAAMTLHQIAQLHRSVGEYNLALSAFSVSLRGMKYCVGRNHPNVAAILGNIGNLQKEMGDMDSSFATYQQVLGIESYRLGLSHPDVAVTLHNIATIDAARGNHEHALSLYRQVIALQRKLFGPNHVAVAVTSACMGDVYERVGEISESIACFEEAVRIKTIAMGRHSLEVARLIHKLGKLAISQGEYHLADSYISRAILIYRLNRLSDLDEWMVEATRDGADVDAAIAMGFVDGTPSSCNSCSRAGGQDSSTSSYDRESSV